MPYQLVSELPQCLIDALKTVSYHKQDIEIIPVEKTHISYAGGAGRRGFAILVNLSSGETKMLFGSWGGANAFNPQNQVDFDQKNYPIPENGAVILGSEGDKTFASIYLNPKNIVPFLNEASEISERERTIMYAYGCIKSGEYRNNELSLLGIKDPKTNSEIQSLIERGLLKRDGRGIQDQISTTRSDRPINHSRTP
jgi:hypothetical protein